MLVLSRKKNQTLVIDGNIEIEVLQVKGNTIRLGIKAPNDVRVLRGELKPFSAEHDNPGRAGNAESSAARIDTNTDNATDFLPPAKSHYSSQAG